MKLASGIAPVPQLLAKKVPVSLGTDGASSNNDLDMLQEMRTCTLLHKVNTMNPTVVPAIRHYRWQLENGAINLGVGDKLGQIKAGMKADLVIVSLEEANMTPRYDIMANLVYAAKSSDVETVIIDGKVVMENRVIKTFNESEVLNKAREIGKKLAGGILIGSCYCFCR